MMTTVMNVPAMTSVISARMILLTMNSIQERNFPPGPMVGSMKITVPSLVIMWFHVMVLYVSVCTSLIFVAEGVFLHSVEN